MNSKKRLLVVDDDVDFADSLADMLDTEGFEVETAYSGREAVGMVRSERFDLALIDVQMPGQDGVESLIEIRELRPSAKVVMMTGYSVPSLLDRAVAEGAWGIIHKPLDIARLLRLIEEGSPSPVILLADDDAEFVASLQALLETAGYVVMIARDGIEVIDRVKRRPPDALLLDLRMPGMSGIDTYNELDRLGLRPPTIVISGFLEQERETLDGVSGLSHDQLVGKPVETDGLLALLGRISASR